MKLIEYIWRWIGGSLMFSAEWNELTRFCRKLPLNRFIAVNYVLECKFGREDFKGLERDVRRFSCRDVVAEWECEKRGLIVSSMKKEKIRDSFLWLMDSKDLERMCMDRIAMTEKHEKYLKALHTSAFGDWKKWVTYDDWLKEAQKDEALFIEGRQPKRIPGTMTNGVFHLQGLIEIDSGKTPRRFRLTYLGKKYVEEKISRIVSEVRRKRIEKTFKRYVSREESPEHKKLKRHLIENAEKIFGEGVELFQEEYLFPTKDQADLIFRHPNGYYIAVEVEVNIEDGEMAGLLQAVKYKYMFAVEHELRFEQVNAVLAARNIHFRIKKLCKKYEVKAIEISISQKMS